MTSDTQNNVSKPKRPRKPNDSNAPRNDKPGLQARQVAAKMLAAVVDRKTSLDGMLDAGNGNPAYKALNESDRALVRAILNSALRQLPRIQAMIGSLLDTPLPDGARTLEHVMAVAATQILYLDVPDHSAVDLAVEQARTDPRTKRFANLVNAVLRRLSREKAPLLKEVGAKVSAIPGWFHQRLVDSYGEAAARDIAEAFLTPAAIDLTVKTDAEGWASKLNGRVLPTGSVRLASFSGAIPNLAGFEDGGWWVQDAAASLPARLFGSLEGKRIIDLCAAPGGKTAQLILAGGEVTALDQSRSRLKRLEGNLARLGLHAETQEADMGKFTTEHLFDAALLDAPCSSTGTIRRHPDVLWTKAPEDVEKLAGVQERLLRHALSLVKPGGLVVFSNCSLDPLEGEMVTQNVINDGLCDRIAIKPSDWPGLEEAVTPLGEFRTTPAMIAPEGEFAGGLDGFFAVVLQRRA